MAQRHGLGLCHQHVVVLLIGLFQHIGTAFRDCQGADHRSHQGQHVLLIDGEPIFYAVTEILEHNFGKVQKPVNRLPVGPGTPLVQSGGHVKVEHGYQRLNAIF